MMKATKIIGTAAGVVSAATAIYGAIEKPTAGNITKAVVNSSLVFAGPYAGFIMGVMDGSGLSDKIYNGIDNLVEE